MNEYKTSNGATVYLDSDGRLKFQRDSPLCANTLEDFWVQAAREYFQAERDEELGRWRDPENPDWVCYLAKEDSVHVFNEQTGNRAFYWLRDSLPARLWLEGAERDSYDAARRYFAAHPEPMPWDAARPGEVWVLTINGDSHPYRRTEHGTWLSVTPGVYLGDDTIEGAHRIWPEEDR